MSREDHLGAYAKGWQEGDIDTVMGSLADNFVFNDPAAGAIPKTGMAAHMTGMAKMVSEARGVQDQQPFMELTEIVTKDEDEVLTCWCWWSIPGTNFSGAGLIKVGDDGVISEAITYNAPPAEG